MYYTIYQITNLINKKTYVGKHQTSNLDDGYMGSGKLICLAIKKYGIENFLKEILFVFETEQEMNHKEEELVTASFCLREDTYNLALGGHGGFEYINRHKLYGFSNPELARKGRKLANDKMKEQWGDDWFAILQKKATNGRIALHEEKWGIDSTYTNRMKESSMIGIAAMNTDEAMAKKKEKFVRNCHAQGSKNSQYGTMWITNGTDNKKIKTEDPIPTHWGRGRTTK